MRRRIHLFVGVTLVLAGLAARDAVGMPAFARRYGVSCAQCHQPFPRLTSFGDLFAGHGFRMAAGEDPRDTLETGDSLLALPRALPVAVRVDGQLQLFTDSPESDFESPWVVKLLSSAALSRDLSYYFYMLLNERGDVAGVEDAFLTWNDMGGRPVDLSVGQFQVSDPLFKRELRLSLEDYAVYRATVGDQPTDLTYDRGVMLAADVAGATVTLEAVNGNGIGGAGSDRRLDDDDVKNVFAHATRDVVPGALRLGAMGYLGRQDGTGSGGNARNEVWMAGADGTVSAGAAELNLQFLYREDLRPTFGPGEPEAVMRGGFAELLLVPDGRRLYGFALYNRVECSRPLLDVHLGGPGGLRRFQSLAAGVGWMAARNLRVQLEAGADLERDEGRATLGMTLAY